VCAGWQVAAHFWDTSEDDLKPSLQHGVQGYEQHDGRRVEGVTCRSPPHLTLRAMEVSRACLLRKTWHTEQGACGSIIELPLEVSLNGVASDYSASVCNSAPNP